MHLINIDTAPEYDFAAETELVNACARGEMIHPNDFFSDRARPPIKVRASQIDWQRPLDPLDIFIGEVRRWWEEQPPL